MKRIPSMLSALSLAFLSSTAHAQQTQTQSPDKWPFIIIRHAHVANTYPDVFKRVLDIASSHPGSCDEVWLCGPGYATREKLLQELPILNQYRDICDKTGIQLSFQQGITVGHGIDPAFKSVRPGFFPFAEDDFMCNETGERLYGQLCPRSKHVQQFAYDYARTVLEIIKPASYWLDDDLRLGVYKRNECFCDRCIAEFNRQNGTAFTRKQLVDKLFSDTPVEPLRGQWCRFNGEAIALYAAQLRKAADEVLPDCRLGYQAVWSDTVYCGADYRALLTALSGKDGKAVGIRPGALHYTEDKPRGMLHKSLCVAREAARCREYGFVAQVCYEQENYTRKVLHKSPEAIMIESTLALASGCDSLSEYYYDSGNHEPLEYYDDFSYEIAAWRPYLERIAASTRRTRLAGVARFLGSHALNLNDFSLDDPLDEFFAACGIPVTIEEAHPDAFYVSPKSVRGMSENDVQVLFAKPAVFVADAFDKLLAAYPDAVLKAAPDAKMARAALGKACSQAKLIRIAKGQEQLPVAPVSNEITPNALHYGCVVAVAVSGARFAIVEHAEQYPTAYRRQALLDALDAVTDGSFPVRLDTHQAVRVLPHVDAEGKLDSVTLINLSIGRTRELVLHVRNTASNSPVIAHPVTADTVPLTADVDGQELKLLLPRLPAWQPMTVFF